MTRGYNQIPPEMLAQAHMIGQPRMRTEAEELEMMQNALTMTVANIAGTVYSAMTEAGNQPSPSVAIDIAKSVLSVSEQIKDEDEPIGKRKMRNQLAAQLFFSALRGGLRPTKPEESLKEFFEEAAQMVTLSEEYAREQVEKEKTDSGIELPS